MARGVVVVIQLIAGVAILLWIVHDASDSFSRLPADSLLPAHAIAGIAFTVSGIVVSIFRWHAIVTALGVDLEWAEGISIGLVSLAFEIVVPVPYGGDLSRSVLVARKHPSSTAIAVVSVLVDRLMGLVGLTITSAATTGWILLASDPSSNIGFVALGLVSVTVAVIALGLALFPSSLFGVLRSAPTHYIPGFGPSLTQLVDELYSVPATALIRKALAQTFVGQTLFLLGMWLLGAALHSDCPSLSSHFLLMPPALMVGALPLTPSGLGILELAASFSFGAAECSTDAVLAMLLGYRAVQLFVACVGLAFYVATRQLTPSEVNLRREDIDASGG